MYSEWMDAVPLILDGYHKYNSEQYFIASNYWKEHGNIEKAQELEELAIEELNLAN